MMTEPLSAEQLESIGGSKPALRPHRQAGHFFATFPQGVTTHEHAHAPLTFNLRDDGGMAGCG
ncbi:hypothetical protein ABFP37_20535 [Burkholderia sp. RS01]|uniref:hypothetical protein n=1 Tax=unclassified Burkholderia TaxID=2613784 RepID=UPI0032181FC1